MHDVGPTRPVVFADSVTGLGSSTGGAVVVCGSHGGSMSAVEALRAGVAALIVHDAAVGCGAAGIAALALLDGWGVPCAAVDFRTARIGDAADCASRGVLSHVNATAVRLGLREGQGVDEAVGVLRRATIAPHQPGGAELALRAPARHVVVGERRQVWLLDSVSQIEERHRGAVVLTGSHGSLLGGRRASAIRIPAFAAVFNDAGCVPTRLDVLDDAGIAGLTVAADSARIGDAESTLTSGVISAVNTAAACLGARIGDGADQFVALAARAPSAAAR